MSTTYRLSKRYAWSLLTSALVTLFLATNVAAVYWTDEHQTDYNNGEAIWTQEAFTYYTNHTTSSVRGLDTSHYIYYDDGSTSSREFDYDGSAKDGDSVEYWSGANWDVTISKGDSQRWVHDYHDGLNDYVDVPKEGSSGEEFARFIITGTSTFWNWTTHEVWFLNWNGSLEECHEIVDGTNVPTSGTNENCPF